MVKEKMLKTSRNQEDFTPEMLLRWGADEGIVYVKPIIVEGVLAYAVHSPDGDPIAVLPNRAGAFAEARRHDFSPVDAH